MYIYISTFLSTRYRYIQLQRDICVVSIHREMHREREIKFMDSPNQAMSINRLPPCMVHKGATQVLILLLPSLSRGKIQSTIAPYSHHPRARITTCEPLPLSSKGTREDRRTNFRSSLTCPSVGCFSHYTGFKRSTEATPSITSIFPHPAQKHMPGNLHPALGRVSPRAFTQ